MNRNEEPIDDVEIVEEAAIIDDVQVVDDLEVIDEVEIITEHPIGEHHAGRYAHESDGGFATPLDDFPRSYGYALAGLCFLAGSICLALGSDYTINHVPAPVIGWPVMAMAIFFAMFPRSTLVRRTFQNMSR